MTSFPTPSQTSSLPSQPLPKPAPRFPDEGTWPPAGYRSADTRAKVAQVVHGATAILTLATAVVLSQRFELLDREDRFQLTQAEFDDWQAQAVLFALVAGVGALVSFISLLTWLSRSVDNTPALGGGIARRGPRWAIGAWFIPIVNIVMPALIIRDLARRVSPTLSGRGWLVLLWWLCYWAPTIGEWYMEYLPIQGTDSVREITAWGIAVLVVHALGYLVTLYLVRRLQRDAEYWHDKRRAEWQAAAIAATVATAAARQEAQAAWQSMPSEPPADAQSTTTTPGPAPRASEPWRPRQE